MMEITEDLLQEAITIVSIEKKASISFLQRRLQIKYFEAQTILEIMESKKMISPYNGLKPREIYL